MMRRYGWAVAKLLVALVAVYAATWCGGWLGRDGDVLALCGALAAGTVAIWLGADGVEDLIS